MVLQLATQAICLADPQDPNVVSRQCLVWIACL
jgi:hypothetical protein